MGRILLIAPHILKDWDYKKYYDMAAPPMGLLSIGTVLKENGFDVDIVDASLSQDYREMIKAALQKRPLFAGISSMTSQVPSAIEIGKYVRQISPDLPMVWGGIHPTLFPEQTCKDSLVDVVVLGEGEYPCLELAQAVQQGDSFRRIRGIGCKENGNIKFTEPRELNDINKLPFPNFEILDVQEYLRRDYGGTGMFLGKRQKTFMLHTGTGCPYRCTFCINSSFYKASRKHRQKTAERILDEIEYIVSKYEVEHVVFRDDNFFINRKRLLEFLDGLERRDFRITWYGTVRADFFKDGSVSDEILKKMAQSGCVRVSIGVESGSEKILKLLKKEITLEHVEQAAYLCRKHGIVVAYSFMMGIPGEEKEDTIKTLRFIHKLIKYNPKDYILGPQIFRPYPGSSLYEECVKRGFVPPQTLRGWGILDDGGTEGYVGLGALPWLEEPKFWQYVNFACQRGVLRPYSEINKGMWWFKFLFGLRLRLRFWRLPFEIGVARFLSWFKRKISKETDSR